MKKNLIKLKIAKLVCLMLFVVSISSEIFAVTFTVTKTADTNDGVCDADCSLREAVAAGNLSPTNDEIVFDPAIFSTLQTIILGGSQLIITNNGSLFVRGTDPNLLMISANNLNTVFVINVGATAILSGITIKDGNGRNTGFAGGGIANLGTLTLNHSIVRNNFGNVFGGGIYNDAAMTIFDTVISNNDGDLNGGGIYNFNDRAILNIFNSTISGNTARRDGGGIWNNGAIAITNSTISGNLASSVNDGGNGGGIHTTGYVNRNSSVSIINSTISNNTCLFSGGGIQNDGSVINLINSTISGNSRTSTLIYHYGGGIINYQLNYPGTVNVRNSIIADNISANGRAPDFGGVLTSQGYNLIENTNETSFTGTMTGNILGQDPKLASLTNNGGSTQTSALLPGSPAIDAITTNFPLNDQRFYVRPADGNNNGSFLSDIGAFEVNATQSTFTVQVSGRITINNNRGAFPARVSMVDNEGNTRISSVNPFGYYRFKDVPAGKTYIFKVGYKRYSFTPKILFVTEEMNNINFLGSN